LITSDYHKKAINPDEFQDLKAIADVGISAITLEEYPNLLVFPDSFESYDRDFGNKVICNILNEGKELYTNSIVGFIGRNKTHLSIHSRFSNDGDEDYFLHYMLQKVASINLFSLQHTMDEDSVFDFLLYLFPLYLKKAVNQGVYKKYISQKYNDANVRGVIDVNRHIRLNEPFNGRIAYNTREYNYDNDVTQLIRHTIEYINKRKDGGAILNMDVDTHQAVAQIVSATPTYVSNERQNIINKNLRPLAHPYYSEYAPLQRLCIQILRHEELKYGQEENEVYGVLIDASWLWEEYLALILKEKFVHYLKDKGKRFYLFENFQQIIPDYISLNKSIVADAKYIPLDRECWYGEEKATSIYYKTITYMYRFCSNKGFLFFPFPDKEVEPINLKIKTEMEGVNGGSIIKLGLRIPSGCYDFMSFSSLMKTYEQNFVDKIDIV
jgi:5-methylcytosine-specific restriction endonuclease McrBC regulatory subunit McrC